MRTMLAARAEDSSQLVGYCAVRIGRLSVKPSTCIGLSNGLNRRHLVDDVERLVAGHGIAAAEQQAGIEFDLDPQLVAAHGHLVGADQVAERGAMSSAMLFSGSLVRHAGIGLLAVLDQRLGRGHGLGRSSPMGIGFMLRSGR
jgi:hypothetical protein